MKSGVRRADASFPSRGGNHKLKTAHIALSERPRMYDFSPNPNATIETTYVGNERQPLIIVEDCLLYPKTVVEYAATAVRFGPPKQMYPGIVAPAPQQYALALLNVIAARVRDTFGVKIEQARVNSFFALTTLPPGQLNIGQRLPHIDTPNPNQIAVLHYLCDASHGGTAFYRHRQSGFESCDEQQYVQLANMLKADADQNGSMPPEYILGSNRLYEQTASVDAKFNRVIIYRSKVLHSGSVSPTANLSPDPRIGRLTVNTFLAFQ